MESFSEEYIHVNGISEYLLHYFSKPEDPLILHIHGGPGAPASVFAYVVEAFSRNYNIVYYDQRGAGKTLLKNPFAKVSMEALQQDLLETVLCLKQKYRKGKLIILGHSWGSVLGSAFVLDHPEHVQAYIGTGQMYCFSENERMGYEFLREAVRRHQDEKAAKALKRIGRYPAENCSFKALLDNSRVRALQGKFGLAMTMDKKALKILRDSPITGPADLPAFLLGGLRSAPVMKNFWNADLRDKGYDYQVPVYYVMGDRDRTTPYEIAREYFEKIRAPYKKWQFVPDAGHFAMLDNTKAWRQAINGIIKDFQNLY